MKGLLTLFLAALLLTTALKVDSREAYTKMSNHQLIAQLVNINSETVGIHALSSFDGFIAEKNPELEFLGGIIQFGDGTKPNTPKINPIAQELVRRGLSTLPDLIHGLEDKRETKLKVGGGFLVEFFSNEYDPKNRPEQPKFKDRKEQFEYFIKQFEEESKQEVGFRGLYTIKVGDVCYDLIGQIVNRYLIPVRYQPSRIMIVNSPIQRPELIQRVKDDWRNVTPEMHFESLVTDLKQTDYKQHAIQAIKRLTFYYPEKFAALKQGDLGEKIRRFQTLKK